MRVAYCCTDAVLPLTDLRKNLLIKCFLWIIFKLRIQSKKNTYNYRVYKTRLVLMCEYSCVPRCSCFIDHASVVFTRV